MLKTSADKARNEDPGLIPERLSCHPCDTAGQCTYYKLASILFISGIY